MTLGQETKCPHLGTSRSVGHSTTPRVFRPQLSIPLRAVPAFRNTSSNHHHLETCNQRYLTLNPTREQVMPRPLSQCWRLNTIQWNTMHLW